MTPPLDGGCNLNPILHIIFTIDASNSRSSLKMSSSSYAYTILEADGQYDDIDLEERLFNDDPAHPVRFLRGALWPLGVDDCLPWTTIPKDIRDEVDGLMILKLFFTEKDLELFPKLKV